MIMAVAMKFYFKMAKYNPKVCTNGNNADTKINICELNFPLD